MDANRSGGVSAARLLGAVLLAIMAVAGTPAVARADTTLTFDDVSPGTLNDQYASRGVTFGGFSCLDDPTVTRRVAARSAPNVVRAARCDTINGLDAQFSTAQSRVSLYVRNIDGLGESSPATLTATDAAGDVVDSASATAVNGSWTLLSIVQPAGALPRMKNVSLRRSDPGDTDQLGIDDFSFGGATAGGGTGDGGTGDGGAPSAPPTPPAAPGPSASFVVRGKLSALGPVVLDAGRTTNASRLRWDLTGDGRTDVVCPGSQPALRFTTTAASARSVTLTAVGSGGATSAATLRLVGGGAS